MKREEKKDSIRYWDKHANSWENMAYDKNKEYLNFPVSQVRQGIAIQAIEKLAKDKTASVIDFGCADGELIRSLLKKGFANVKGIDNSGKMIEKAKARLREDMPDIDPDKVFFVDCADDFDTDETFDFVTAMGLIEYLLNTNDFFAKLSRILKPKGYAFVESRNKLFNLYSANAYTHQSPVKELIEELKDVERFSPVKSHEKIEDIVKKTFVSIGENLKKSNKETGKKNEFGKYPYHLAQFTPKEIEAFAKKQRLKLEHVVFYHPHPFLPGYEDYFPSTFNRVAFSMQSLGYTPLGATICSAFIALIKK